MRINGVSGNDVRCGIYDSEGRYWAGTESGICFYDKGRWRRLREAASGYGLLVPSLIFLAIVVAWPLLRAIWLSFHKYYLLHGFDSQVWVGLQNYIDFFKNPRASLYIKNVLILLIGTVVGRLVFSMVLALLMNRDLPLRWLFRGLVILPWVMPSAVTAIMWKWILSAEWGVLNYLLTKIGLLDNYVAFLGDPKYVWPTIIVVGIWQWFAFDYVTILAGLQTIPKELNEAAEIDGANEIQTFWYVTIPMLRPVLSVLILLEVVWTLRDFATVWTLTEGGPGHSTMTLAPLVYITSFKYFKLGLGASIGMIILVISLIFNVIYLRRVRFEIE